MCDFNSGDSQIRIVKETKQSLSRKYSISVFVNPSAYFKHKAPEERQGVSLVAQRKIFFLKESATAFQTPAQQPQRKVNEQRQRQQLGERCQCCGRESDRSSLPTGGSYLCSSSKFFRFTFSNSAFYTLGNSISDSDCWGLCLCCYLSVYILIFAFLALKLNHRIVFGTELGETSPNMATQCSCLSVRGYNSRRISNHNKLKILLAFFWFSGMF